jgi:AAA15 family ATPase/GTPase
LHGQNEVIKEVTRPNALFLSAAAQNNDLQLLSIYNWFQKVFPANLAAHNGNSGFPFSIFYLPQMFSGVPEGLIQQIPGNETVSGENREAAWAKLIRQLLMAADTGIVDVRFVSEPGAQNQKARRLPRIQLKHQIRDENSWLELQEESQGTQTLLKMVNSFFETLNSGGLLLVDELESSLHPLLGVAIVNMFNDRKINATNAKLDGVFRLKLTYTCRLSNLAATVRQTPKATIIYSRVLKPNRGHSVLNLRITKNAISWSWQSTNNRTA